MSRMPSMLRAIIDHKREEVAARRKRYSLAALQEAAATRGPVRGFRQALRERVEQGEVAVIAEIKKASPSAGLIRPDFRPARIAGQYQAAGAACLSVLTDEHFFQGRDRYLRAAREACALPVLRKDFILDHYQVPETRALSADALLLIAAALDPVLLQELYLHARELELDVLLEVHDENELEQVLALPEPESDLLVGINNRDLHRFHTDLGVSERLLPMLPARCLAVSESGVHNRADLKRLRACGVQVFLIGETLMRAADPGAALAELLHTDGGF